MTVVSNVFVPAFPVLTSAAVIAALGYTPVNRAGDTMTGPLLFSPDNTYDIGANGATRPRIIYAATNIIAGVNLYSGNSVFFPNGSRISDASDGVIRLWNTAGTSFTRLNFGGDTAAFPSWKRSSGELHARFADDSGYTDVRARQLIVSSGVQYTGTTVAALPSASGVGAGTLWYVTDANATTRLSVVVGGGANKLMVFSDGASWLIL